MKLGSIYLYRGYFVLINIYIYNIPIPNANNNVSSKNIKTVIHELILNKNDLTFESIKTI